MQVHELFAALGEERFRELLAGISIGRLKTYQLYEGLKVRLHVAKLNAETLRKVPPRLWERINAADEDLAVDLAQSILISKMEMVMQVLDFLGIPHNEGFFDKETDLASHLSDGWQQRVMDEFKGKYADSLLVFYVNHLAKEASSGEADVYLPAA